MKKIILALVAASVLGAPVAAAPFNRHGSVSHVTKTKQVVAKRIGRKVVTTRTVVEAKPVQHRRWAKGQRFNSRYAYNYRVINNTRANRLYDAPRFSQATTRFWSVSRAASSARFCSAC